MMRTLPDILTGLRNGDKLPTEERERIASAFESQAKLMKRLRVFLGVVAAEATFRDAPRVRKGANLAIGEIIKLKNGLK